MSDTPGRFTTVPVTIDAVRWTGDNIDEIHSFCGTRQVESGGRTVTEDNFLVPRDLDGEWSPHEALVWAAQEETYVRCLVGHWVIRGVERELYPCSDRVFQRTYRPEETAVRRVDIRDEWGRWRDLELPPGSWRLRTGNKIPRNLYIEWDDGKSEPVGQVDTASLAALITIAVNAALEKEQLR